MEEAAASLELRGLPPEVPDELVTLYFENQRRSGGGPVLSWQRLGDGGILTFQEPADAARALLQGVHVLCQARLNLRPAAPRAPARLLLSGLPPGVEESRLQQHVRALLHAAGLSEQPCWSLASPRPDRSLVQLTEPLTESEVSMLEEQAQVLDLDGVTVSLARVPQAHEVWVMGGLSPPDPLLLELYLENEGRSGGGPLEGLHSLPGILGTVVSFRQWQVAERVLQQDHWLQGSELRLFPYYQVLEPQELGQDTYGGDHSAGAWQGTEHSLPRAGEPAMALEGSKTVTKKGPEEAPRQTGAALTHGPEGGPEPEGVVEKVPLNPGLEEPMIPGPLGCLWLLEAGLVEIEQVQAEPVEEKQVEEKQVEEKQVEVEQGGTVEMVLPMEPGALRYLQLYHEDLLASLGDVALFPLEGMDVTGFRLSGEHAPCQAAEEFLQSLLGSLSCHLLSLRHRGSARFLLCSQGQQLLRGLEAQFQCVFGTERLARVAVDIDSEEGDPTEALGASPMLFPDGSSGDRENVNLEELLATLEGLGREAQLPLGLGTEQPEEEEEKDKEASVSADYAEGQPVAPSTRAAGQLEEAAAIQLALHRSLDPQGGVAEQEEAAALQRALALSLLEQPLLEEQPLGGSTGPAQLVVHTAFEQDTEELERALEEALEPYIREVTVDTHGRELSWELYKALERCHGVHISLHGEHATLLGFEAQPTRAARHLTALLAEPRNQSQALALVTPDPPLPRPSRKGPSEALECLSESSEEFQGLVQAFYDTLDAAHNTLRIVRVERISHPLLQRQYELQRELLEQCCEQWPVEHVLYHGTSESSVADICTHGFNRSYCGRNGTLYGQGVYFAKRASLSVQDRYSPPNADGHKAVFVARVLTGDYGQGCQGLLAPPPRDSGHRLLRYNSVVDNLSEPSIFVIFHDTQALPTHLITCEHTPLGPLRDPSGVSGHSSTA
ncbi:protein mono-ADP-ribosyltransferase PARP10 [Tenrec ecaudatus]|uniref:protein mono-ADP-ribosyltransferase PARP10 n=1 Tax=Tenrec ecaudatus TaxID=94439 RepID=UPI003F5992A6